MAATLEAPLEMEQINVHALRGEIQLARAEVASSRARVKGLMNHARKAGQDLAALDKALDRFERTLAQPTEAEHGQEEHTE